MYILLVNKKACHSAQFFEFYSELSCLFFNIILLSLLFHSDHQPI